MDQKKIGKFIAFCRKEQGFTQAALAEKLGITDRAVSKWETGNMKDICGLFLGCSSLKELPDTSKWSTKNVINMMGLFFGCKNLKSLPDISGWNTDKVIFYEFLICKM